MAQRSTFCGAAARKIIMDSPDLKRLLKDAGAQIVEPSATTASPVAH